MQRRTFKEEFKHGAVKPVWQPGASKAGIARDLGAGANMSGRWCREQEIRAFPARTGSGDAVSIQEFESMRRELAKVKTERDILKKALGYFAVDPK
jgi:transposase